MKTYGRVLLCVLLIACLSSCSFLLWIGMLTDPYPFHADLTLADLSGNLTWNEAPAYTVEYLWGVKIDWDANPTTGDPDGFDVFVWIMQTSSGGGPSGGQPLDEEFSAFLGQDIFTIEAWIREGGSLVQQTDMSPVWTVNGNTIGITFNLLDDGTAPTAGFRTQFYASYYPPPAGPAVSDETSIVTDSASTADAAGDASSYPFVDIVSAAISYVP